MSESFEKLKKSEKFFFTLHFLGLNKLKKIMSLTIKILGCGSALPTTIRNASAQILNHNNKLFLIDCAESTQISIRRANIRFASINNIFISHLHGDHFYGLFGLLSSFALTGRKSVMHIYCPEKLINMLSSPFSPVNLDDLGFQIEFHILNPSGVNMIFEDKTFQAYSVPLIHRIPTWGFIFKEKLLQRNIKKDCIEKYQISIAEIVQIKLGSDLRLSDGTIIPNSELTTDPPKPKSYAYISDTLSFDGIAKAVSNIDVLYHEATYDSSLEKRAKETFHCTTFQAAENALKANVGKLVLGHFSSRYQDVKILENEAKTIFSNTFCAFDGMEIDV